MEILTNIQKIYTLEITIIICNNNYNNTFLYTYIIHTKNSVLVLHFKKRSGYSLTE